MPRSSETIHSSTTINAGIQLADLGLGRLVRESEVPAFRAQFSGANLCPRGKDFLAYMPSSPEPLWNFNDEEEASFNRTADYFNFMQHLPEAAGEIPGVLEYLSGAPQLELANFNLNSLTPPLVTRGDVVYDARSGVFKLVDPNVIPSGVPDVLSIKRLWENGVSYEGTFLVGIWSWLTNHGLDPREAHIGLLSNKNSGSSMAHHLMADMLNEHYISCTSVSPEELSVQGDMVVDEAGRKIDVIWNRLSGIGQKCPELTSAWKEGQVLMINPPGIRIMETKAWFALLRLPGIQEYFLAKGLLNPELLEVIPEAYLVEKEGGKLKICTEWGGDHPVFKEGIAPIEDWFGPQDRRTVFVKAMDTTMARGVRYTHLKNVADRMEEMGVKTAIVERPSIPGNNSFGFKFEIYTVWFEGKYVPFAYATLKGNTAGIIHGGTGTVQSLVGRVNS